MCVLAHTYLGTAHVGRDRQEADCMAALDIWVSWQHLASPSAFGPDQKPDLGAQESLSHQEKMINENDRHNGACPERALWQC